MLWLTYSSQNRWLIDYFWFMENESIYAKKVWQQLLIWTTGTCSVFSQLWTQIPSDSQHMQPGWGVEVTVPFSHTHKLNIDDFPSCYWFLSPNVCSSHSSREALRRPDCTWYLQNRFSFFHRCEQKLCFFFFFPPGIPSICSKKISSQSFNIPLQTGNRLFDFMSEEFQGILF